MRKVRAVILGDMRVVAARFPEPDKASAARALVQRELAVTDIAVAPLGHPGEAETDDALLAGRVPDDQVEMLVRLVERAGGEIVADVDERRTAPHPSSSANASRRGATSGATEAYLR